MNRIDANWIFNARRHALLIGTIGLAICVIVGLFPSMRNTFFNAYFFAWLFFLAISLGSLAITMMHYLTGGDWGVLIRPITISAARVLPLLLILFFPIFLGLGYLFPWARPEEVSHDPILMHVRAYFTPAAFFVRFVIYFALWIGISWLLVHRNSEGLRRRVSAIGLVIYVILMTLAGVDWILSREPHWVSSVLGFILVVSQVLTAFCFAIVILWSRRSVPQIVEFAKPRHFIDLGNLVLMMLILWAYMNFSQYLITWTGNEQEDVAYYVQRTYGGWRVVAGIVVFVHFLAPLILLLMRDIKQDISRLAILCGALLALRVVDLFWIVGPFERSGWHNNFFISPLALPALVGLGGLWFATFSLYLERTQVLATSGLPGEISHGKQAAQPG